MASDRAMVAVIAEANRVSLLGLGECDSTRTAGGKAGFMGKAVVQLLDPQTDRPMRGGADRDTSDVT